jgi:hypothetical protein
MAPSTGSGQAGGGGNIQRPTFNAQRGKAEGNPPSLRFGAAAVPAGGWRMAPTLSARTGRQRTFDSSRPFQSGAEATAIQALREDRWPAPTRQRFGVRSSEF